jgi:hypothetical protein
MAEGLGDTFIAAGYNAARAMHAAHVIHDLTGRDVVSFGRGGASSAEALVREPVHILAGSRCLFFPTIEEPSQIFAYFYEGNDVQDNLAFAKKVAQKFGRADRQAVDAYLSNDYARFTMWRCHLYLGDAASRVWSLLYRHYYVGINPLPQMPLGTMLLVGGKMIDGPAPLDGPALEVDDEDIQAGIAIFDRSLSWLRSRFPQVPITVVYVPAALSIFA